MNITTEMQDTNTILEFRNVVKAYDSGVRALDGLCLSVSEGSILGFIGLNGAGKTSTIRIVAGLSRKDEGEVMIFGNELTGTDHSYKRDIGFVLDEPLYFDWMTPREYLAFVGAMYHLDAQAIELRTDELLELFDLRIKENDPIRSFSTGMKKKISLAAAIIHKPKLIILDEPLEGIDALASSSIKETLTLMASRGSTIIITSHVLDTVEKFCTDIAVIHLGKILLQCKTGDLRVRAKGTITEETYQSLEELFVDLVSGMVKKKHLSWL